MGHGPTGPAGAGARVIVAGLAPFTEWLTAGLSAAGATVRLADPADGHPGAVHPDDVGRRPVGAALDDAARSLGGVDAVVHAWVHPELLVAEPLVDVPADRWRRACEGSLDRIWWFAQALGDRVGHWRPRSVVFVIPTAGLSGLTNGAMLATVAEGVRQLAKGCATQWGDHGTTVNAVATRSTLWLPGPGDAFALTDAPVPGAGDPAVDVAPLVALLGDPAASFLTAATLVADGGLWRGL